MIKSQSKKETTNTQKVFYLLYHVYLSNFTNKSYLRNFQIYSAIDFPKCFKNFKTSNTDISDHLRCLRKTVRNGTNKLKREKTSKQKGVTYLLN